MGLKFESISIAYRALYDLVPPDSCPNPPFLIQSALATEFLAHFKSTSAGPLLFLFTLPEIFFLNTFEVCLNIPL